MFLVKYYLLQTINRLNTTCYEQSNIFLYFSFLDYIRHITDIYIRHTIGMQNVKYYSLYTTHLYIYNKHAKG